MVSKSSPVKLRQEGPRLGGRYCGTQQMVAASGQLTSPRAPPRFGVSARGRRGPASTGPLRFRAPRPGAAITGRRAPPLWAAPVTGATAALPPCGPRPSLRAIFKLRSCGSHWAQRDGPARTPGPQGDARRGGAAAGTAVRLARGRPRGTGGASGVAGPPGRSPEAGPGAAGRKWGRAARGSTHRPTVRQLGRAARWVDMKMPCPGGWWLHLPG